MEDDYDPDAYGASSDEFSPVTKEAPQAGEAQPAGRGDQGGHPKSEYVDEHNGGGGAVEEQYEVDYVEHGDEHGQEGYEKQQEHSYDELEGGHEPAGKEGVGGGGKPSEYGTKRKVEEDGRPVDPNSTTAVMISELQWWMSDDDIRGFAQEASCEDELDDISFSEHKVNGKSKGQAYVEFASPQAATAFKHRIEEYIASDSCQPAFKCLSIAYADPGVNPFETLPKEGAARVGNGQARIPTGPGQHGGGPPSGPRGDNYGGNTRDQGPYGDRGGFRGRGGFGGQRGNSFNNNGFNRNFSGNMGNFGGGPMGGGNFGGPMGGGGNFGGFNRGGGGGQMRGGMRGGRGGGWPQGGMGMGGMGMGMGMGMGKMGGMDGIPNMPMGMMGGGMPGFNQGFQMGFGPGPGFFPNAQQPSGNENWGNPHGTKRHRPE